MWRGGLEIENICCINKRLKLCRTLVADESTYNIFGQSWTKPAERYINRDGSPSYASCAHVPGFLCARTRPLPCSISYAICGALAVFRPKALCFSGAAKLSILSQRETDEKNRHQKTATFKVGQLCASLRLRCRQTTTTTPTSPTPSTRVSPSDRLNGMLPPACSTTFDLHN